MDVRCEKCQTEYELDESRLKPGGVTVKCTNCGHMFKIRKRTITNVGTPPIASGPPPSARDAGEITRRRPNSSRQPLGGGPPVAPGALGKARGDSLFEDDARQTAEDAPTTVDRQWLIRLENGEQRSCRELATLQQWIISSAVTRESLISRTGKTWKRLGDIADLGQYFAIADEARATRERARPASRPAPPATPGPVKEVPGTIPGYGAAAVAGHGTAPQAAGGTILPDDDDDLPEARTTRSIQARPGVPTPPPVPPRAVVRTPPLGSMGAGSAPATAAGPAVAPPQVPSPQVPPRRPRTTPPPPPPKRLGAPTPPVPPPIPQAQGNRATAMWATEGVPPEASKLPDSAPFVGKLAAIPDEPAFAGRVRMTPGDDATFDTAKVRAADEDDAVLPARRGSRVGMLVLVTALAVMGAAAAGVYLFVFRKAPPEHAAAPARDAGAVATVTPDAAQIVAPSPVLDAAAPPQPSPLDAVRGELAADVEPRLRTAMQSLDGKPDGPAQGLRAHLIAQLAQDLQDRASVTADRAIADALRKEARQLVLDAATAAQRALKIAGDDPGANLAMAEVLRLQGKPARDGQRYLDAARARADKELARDLALADALVLVRDGKLDEARAAFAAIDQGDGKLESSGDVRARFHLALVLAAQNKAADARPLVETILAAQPEHAGARALADKLATQVTKTDPLPPEEAGKSPGPGPGPGKDTGATRPPPGGPGPAPEAPAGEPFDRLLKRADALAETSCAKAIDLYKKALEQKPQSVEALTGMGYCYIDAKLFASAHSEFRAALTVSPRYEPALLGIADAYRQQGLKDQAIEAYKACLEVHPNSVAAKRQLEQLGVSAASSPGPGPGGGAGSPPTPPPSAPSPAPQPTAPAAPEPGAGAGSG